MCLDCTCSRRSLTELIITSKSYILYIFSDMHDRWTQYKLHESVWTDLWQGNWWEVQKIDRDKLGLDSIKNLLEMSKLVYSMFLQMDLICITFSKTFSLLTLCARRNKLQLPDSQTLSYTNSLLFDLSIGCRFRWFLCGEGSGSMMNEVMCIHFWRTLKLN